MNLTELRNYHPALQNISDQMSFEDLAELRTALDKEVLYVQVNIPLPNGQIVSFNELNDDVIYLKPLLMKSGLEGALFEAAIHGNLRAVRLLLKKGVHVAEDVLTAVISQANYEMVKLLLQNNSDINIKDVHGPNLLAKTIEQVKRVPSDQTSQIIKIIKLLLASGLRIDGRHQNSGRPYFHYILDTFTGSHTLPRSYNRVAQVQALSELLPYISNIDETDVYHQTLLSKAIYHRNDQMVKLLLDNGADPNELINHPDFRFDRKVADYDVKLGDIIDLLLEYGFDMNRPDSEGRTILMKNIKHPKVFLEKGADVNAVNKLGETALMHAVFEKDPRIVAWLLEKGANINAVDEDGNSAIMLAIHPMNLREQVYQLLVNKPDLNIVNKDGKDALTLALENRDQEYASLLLDFGANPEIAQRWYPQLMTDLIPYHQNRIRPPGLILE